jgi:1-acyl-sn-glycerol-3-phosphate acyltransferase
VPIVPVSISGSRYVMRKGRLMVCPGKVTVTVHEPIEPSGTSRSAVRELVDRVRENVRTSVDEPASADSSA